LDTEIIFADEGFEIEEDGVRINSENKQYYENINNIKPTTQVLIRKLALLQTDDFSDDKLKRKRDCLTNNYVDVKNNKNEESNLVIKTNKGETEFKPKLSQSQKFVQSNSNMNNRSSSNMYSQFSDIKNTN